MVLLDNQVFSPKSVLGDKAFEDSSNDSDFDLESYINDGEDNGDNVVVPQTLNIVMSSDEASPEVTYTSISSDYEEPSDVGPEYPEYLAPSDEEVPVEDQPYAVVDS
ncbi:hypothetical protein Tco_0695089 [Tanacetum coccineum]